MRCYLMNKNYKVLEIDYNKDLDVISKIYEIIDIHRTPLAFENACADKSKSNLKTINHWFKGRGIPSWRKDLQKLLNNLHVQSTDELLNKCYALSLSDQYWIVEKESDLRWEDINFFTNDFEFKGYMEATFSDSSKKAPSLNSPNNTTDGMLPKAWVIEGKKRILVKNTYTNSRQEPLNEWFASKICEVLGIDHVSYQVDVQNNKLISKCEDFISSNEELIGAIEIYELNKQSNSISDLDHYISILREQGIKNARRKVEEMILLDYLIMNTDRHMKNFGIIRNVDTLEWKMAPIFDNGQSMNCEHILQDINFTDGYGKLFSNTHKKFSSYLDEIEDLSVYDFCSIKKTIDPFKSQLIKYQVFTEMSDERISSLVSGFSNRLDKLIDIQNKAK